ncbi:myomegalin-like isoform X2 [Nycticebus coucang]|uniref:myomegalin-like isoform X2 n=1 Tax=Nycticebus coucang TaxID=9470 RepID=UPI00234D34DD|nr:myomegalin-like isoform X2 [Nycticebus coucang]
MHQPLEKKGPAEKGVNEQEQKTRPGKAGLSSVFCSGKYHSLIQDQARELTHLRQKMRIGRAVSSLLIQHVKNTVKTFEELLRSHSIDHYMELHFREQLAKGSQLAESLASKFSTDDFISKKNQAGQVPLTTLREMHKKGKVTEVPETKQGAWSQTWPQVLSSSHTRTATHHSHSSTSAWTAEQEMPPAVAAINVSPAIPADSTVLPSNYSGARSAQTFYPLHGTNQLSRTPEHGSSGLREEMRPQKMNASGDLSSFSSLYRPNSRSSGADLLEKNLVEIQKLRQRLEESVCINDRLRERLEHVLSNADQGKTLSLPLGTAHSAPDVSFTAPRSHTQSHPSGSGQDIL